MTERLGKDQLAWKVRCGSIQIVYNGISSDLSQAANSFISIAYTELNSFPHCLLRCARAGLDLSNRVVCCLANTTWNSTASGFGFDCASKLTDWKIEHLAHP